MFSVISLASFKVRGAGLWGCHTLIVSFKNSLEYLFIKIKNLVITYEVNIIYF
jgi:hypothetical protein